ncbi:MAG: hypothetical protein WKF30_14845, partial [Pyrinomonadaceae bacterium]
NGAPSDEQLKSALSSLDKLIVSFVTNRIFKYTNTIDLKLSVQAKSDLENIIDLSGQVSKNAEKMQKTAK